MRTSLPISGWKPPLRSGSSSISRWARRDGSLAGSWRDPSGILPGSWPEPSGDGSGTVRGGFGGGSGVRPRRRPRRWRGGGRGASAVGGEPRRILAGSWPEPSGTVRGRFEVGSRGAGRRMRRQTASATPAMARRRARGERERWRASPDPCGTVRERFEVGSRGAGRRMRRQARPADPAMPPLRSGSASILRRVRQVRARPVGCLAASFREAGEILPGSFREAGRNLPGRFEGVGAAEGPSEPRRRSRRWRGAGRSATAPRGPLVNAPGRGVQRERGIRRWKGFMVKPFFGVHLKPARQRTALSQVQAHLDRHPRGNR